MPGMTPEQITKMRDELARVIAVALFEKHGLSDGLGETAADAAMAVIEDEAIDRMAEKLAEETNLRSMDFRNGFAMDVEPSRALVANWVGAARGMLGDAENYSETPITMTVKVAEEPERFAFILQRVGKLTPHQARMKAEAEVERLRAELAGVHGDIRVCLGAIFDGEQERVESVLAARRSRLVGLDIPDGGETP